MIEKAHSFFVYQEAKNTLVYSTLRQKPLCGGDTAKENPSPWKVCLGWCWHCRSAAGGPGWGWGWPPVRSGTTKAIITWKEKQRKQNFYYNWLCVAANFLSRTKNRVLFPPRSNKYLISLTSFPFVSPLSNHSTVTLRVSGLMPDTTAEWMRPGKEQKVN